MSAPRRDRAVRRMRAIPCLLEALEARTLLSAAIQVAGNSNLIAAGDITPSIADFTDFGPMSSTFKANLGRVSRTFVISDTGDTDLTLTPGAPGKLIKITGANAGDFVITANPATTIAAGTTSSFTITFTPKGTGLRKATVTLLTNDPAHPAFSFSIQGTAIKTSTLASGVQVGTQIKGTGVGAISGTAINITYSGYLLTNQYITNAGGGTPLVVSLGQSPLITGLAQGLAGIKEGETRLVVIPASLAYGSGGTTNVPPDSNVIFLLTANTVAIPTVNVSGSVNSSDVLIAFKDNTPSTTDGTLIGTTVAGSLAPLSTTFKITNGNDGTVVFPKSPVVILSKNSGNFTTTDITIDPTSTFATFTVTYTPTKADTQSALVHVRTSDPLHPDFTFTVAGTATPFIDFSATSIGTINYPVSGSVVSGSSIKYKVPVTVANLGNTNVPGNTPPVPFNFYLHDANLGTDTLIDSQTSTALRGTKGGKSKTLNFNVGIPNTIIGGNYSLVVKVNENAAATETSEGNNLATSSQFITVTQGLFNVDGLLSSSSFSTTVSSLVTLKGTLNVLVRNTGTLALPANQKFTLQLVAHHDAGSDSVLSSTTLTLSNWVSGRTQVFGVSAKLLSPLVAGHYTLQGVLTPVTALNETSTADNRVALTLANTPIELTIT